MNEETIRSSTPRLVMGLLILAAGVLLTLQEFVPGFHIGNLWDFWPLILIGIGLSKLLNPRRTSSRVWGALFLLFGVLFQLHELGFTHIRFSAVFPLLVVSIGLLLVWRALDRRSALRASSEDESISRLSEWAAFGGGERRISSSDFRGGDVTVVFGGYDIDLTNAVILEDEAVIDVFAMFGGVELKIPESWSCRADGVALFGGFDDKSRHPAAEPEVPVKRLVVRGWAVFGGVEVRN